MGLSPRLCKLQLSLQLPAFLGPFSGAHNGEPVQWFCMLSTCWGFRDHSHSTRQIMLPKFRVLYMQFPSRCTSSTWPTLLRKHPCRWNKPSQASQSRWGQKRLCSAILLEGRHHWRFASNSPKYWANLNKISREVRKSITIISVLTTAQILIVLTSHSGGEKQTCEEKYGLKQPSLPHLPWRRF